MLKHHHQCVLQTDGYRKMQKALVVAGLCLITAKEVHAMEIDGLGSYGVSGDIQREQLPQGIRNVVSDKAINLAKSRTLARARAQWNRQTPSRSLNVGVIDFVDQVDYQLTFRAGVDYLDASPRQIAKVLETKPQNHGIETMQLYLSPAEAREMTRRDRVGRLSPALERIVKNGDRRRSRSNFAGIWQDQKNGGKLVLAVLNRSLVVKNAFVRRMVANGNLKVVVQRYSLAEQKRFKRILSTELRALALDFVVQTSMTDKGSLLEIRTPNPEQLPSDFASSVPRDAYRAIRGNGLKAMGGPQTTHDFVDQQPGLAIAVWDGSIPAGQPCTWGFNAHTSNFNYIVTAGHCLARYFSGSGGQTGQFSGRFGWDIQIWQRTAVTFWDKQLTVFDAFTWAIKDGNYDMARIESTYADDNCYHGSSTQAGSGDGGHCQWPMANRALHNSWTPGTHRTCASLGQSNTYRCGFILEEGVPAGDWIRLVRTDLQAAPGDSGAGAKWSYTIDGLIVAAAINDGESSGPAYFHTAYDVQRISGVSFNCADGETSRNAGAWGACPSIDRSP